MRVKITSGIFRIREKEYAGKRAGVFRRKDPCGSGGDMHRPGSIATLKRIPIEHAVTSLIR
jgi:hypothetical protein